MNPDPRPEFRDLSADEAEAVLMRNDVGRLAFSYRGRVDIEPIHYAFHDGWIYGRTGPGTKLDRVEKNRWVAFEVDEVDDVLEWRSVVVHGGFYILSPEGPEWERAALDTALAQIRRVYPDAFTERDRTPFRDVVFRIAVQEMVGRAATMSGAPPKVR